MDQDKLPAWAVMEPPQGATWFVRFSFYLHRPHSRMLIYSWVAGTLGFWALVAQGGQHWDWFLWGHPHTAFVAINAALYVATRRAYLKHGGIKGLKYNPRAKPIKRPN